LKPLTEAFFMSFLKDLKFNILTKGFGLYVNSLHYLNAKFAAQTAYTLFSVPRRGMLKVLPTFLSSSKTKDLYFNEKKIKTYEWEGTKETVLLIHGWESNANRWQGVIQYLKKKNYRLVALDAPGQGLSDGKELNAVLYSQFINEVVKHYRPDFMIGHSLGGMTMFYYMSVYQPDFVKKIVSLAAPNRFIRITDNYRNMLSLSKKTYINFLLEFENRFQVNPKLFNSEDFVKKIKIPIAMIHDTIDTVVPYKDSLEVIQNNPKIPLFSTHGLGHSLYHQKVNKQIVCFFENDENQFC